MVQCLHLNLQRIEPYQQGLVLVPLPSIVSALKRSKPYHPHDFQHFYLIQVRLRTEVPSTPSSTRPGLELMTSRSWQHISWHWHACSNHLPISDFFFYAVTNSHKYSFFIQWVHHWNLLPLSISAMAALSSFKAAMYTYSPYNNYQNFYL